jgi:hypothetical protein
MSKQKGWYISKIGWCVGSNTAHLAKLPHFPSSLSLFLERVDSFDGDSAKVKLVSKPTITNKGGVLVKTFFLFRRLSDTVNADRVKRKLPSLLVDGSTTKKKSWNSLMRYRYRFTQFKKR